MWQLENRIEPCLTGHNKNNSLRNTEYTDRHPQLKTPGDQKLRFRILFQLAGPKIGRPRLFRTNGLIF
jgi:hypothetical protein